METTVILIDSPAEDDEQRRYRLEQCKAIRRTVFVEGQHVPASIDFDGLDDACAHLLLLRGTEPVGTMRIRATEKGSKFERIAILPGFRGQGFGSCMVRCALSVAPPPVYLHAQLPSEGFYRNLGFVAEDPTVFHEAGIPHKTMHYHAQSQGEPLSCNITRLS